MARPTNKEQLLELAEKNYTALVSLIDGLSTEQQQQNFPFEGRDRNIRDCLVHLYEWHQLLLHWIASNQAGKTVPFLPEPYNWKTYPDMNVQLWAKHQSTSLASAKKQFTASHQQCMKTIDSFSNDELFIKKHFKWTGTTSLGSYAISATSSHYDWALKIIKQYAKSLSKKK